MNTGLALVLALSLGQSAKTDAREPHPFAPTLPQLTAKEEARYQAIIDNFIKYDTGKLAGAAGKKALEEFNALPPEAIFVLIEGYNKAAQMEASCPAVLIGKKIMKVLGTSNDLDLLAFAKENVGAGVTAKRHQGMTKDVQFSIQLRKGAIQRQLAALGLPPGQKAPFMMALPELAKAAERKKGPQLKAILTEVEKRQGPVVFDTLGIAAASPDKDVKDLGAGLLAKHLAKLPQAQLKDLLKHDKSEVKAAAAKEAGTRGLKLGAELIDLLQDSEPAVQQAARSALVRLSRGLDHGFEPDASIGERETAIRRWREWWSSAKTAK